MTLSKQNSIDDLLIDDDDEIIVLTDEIDLGQPETSNEIDDLQRLIDEVVDEYPYSQDTEKPTSGAEKPAISNEIEILSAVSDEKIEAALERIIERVFAARIESTLKEAVNQAIIREIEELKKGLLYYLQAGHFPKKN